MSGGQGHEQPSDAAPYISPERIVAALLRAHPDRSAAVPPRLVVVYDRELFAAVIEAFDAKPLADWMYADRPMRRLYASASLPGVALLHTEIGAPLIAYLLELLAACGARDVLVVTSAGAISEGLEVGSLFVVESAVSRNGVTAALDLDRSEFAADGEATGELLAAFATAGHEAQVVRALSCDLFFRDAPGFWAGVVDGGESVPDIVEMELATVFAIAEKCGVRACAAGYVADVLARTWTRSQESYYPVDRLRLVSVVRAYAVGA